MQIDKIQAKIRPRSNWEAVDLGFVMTNTWKVNLYMVWFLVTLPFFILFNVLFYDNMFLFLAAFWLFIPIYDRFILLAVSRRLFDEKIAAVDVIRAAPRLFFKHIIKHLTLYRFDPARSFNLPVWFLENLSGSKRSARARILKITASGTASTLTTACSGLIFFLYLAIVTTLVSFIPGFELLGNMFRDSFETIIALYQSDSWYVQLFANSLFYIAITLVEPFYVCAGFALYLNRRTQLESWDIELSFKSLRNRLEEKKQRFEMAGAKKSATNLVFITALGAYILLSPAVYMPEAFAAGKQNISKNTPQSASIAQDRSKDCPDLYDFDKKVCRKQIVEDDIKRSPDCIEWENKLNQQPTNKAEAELRKLLSEKKYVKCSVITRFERDPDKFNYDDSLWKKFWDYVFKNRKKSTSETNTGDISWANIIEIFIWTVVVIAIIYLLIQLYKYRNNVMDFFTPSADNDDEIPTEIFGLDITPESIPQNLSDEVLKLWEQGEHIKALSLLYRGYLSKLVHDFEVDIRASFTENDCLGAAKQAIKHKNLINLFRDITNLWLKLAYAHRTPADSAIVECCRNWRIIFESTSNAGEVHRV